MITAVTGATGFVGRHLVDALLRRGDAVKCLARSEAKASRLTSLGCDTVVGTLDDIDALQRLTQGAELIYHVAGLVAARSEREFYQVNRGGTERLLSAAADAGVRRVIYVSSLAATGPNPRGFPSTDTTPPAPVTVYGKSKLAGEDAVRQSGVAFTMLRPPTVYGPGDRELLKVFRLARLGAVPILGDGEQELSLVYVTDLANALVAAGTSERAAGKIYHVAHAEIVTQAGLVDRIAAAVDRKVRHIRLSAGTTRRMLSISGALAKLLRMPTLLTPDKADEFLAAAWTCASTGLAQELGWTAQTDLVTGLSDTAAWYREHRWL